MPDTGKRILQNQNNYPNQGQESLSVIAWELNSLVVHHKYFYGEIKYYLEQIEDYNKLPHDKKDLILSSIKKEL